MDIKPLIGMVLSAFSNQPESGQRAAEMYYRLGNLRKKSELEKAKRELKNRTDKVIYDVITLARRGEKVTPEQIHQIMVNSGIPQQYWGPVQMKVAVELRKERGVQREEMKFSQKQEDRLAGRQMMGLLSGTNLKEPGVMGMAWKEAMSSPAALNVFSKYMGVQKSLAEPSFAEKLSAQTEKEKKMALFRKKLGPSEGRALTEYINPKTGDVKQVPNNVQPPPGYVKNRSKLSFETTSEGAVKFSMGGIGDRLTPTTKTQLQKEVVSLTERLNEAESMGAEVYKDALTLQGKAKAGTIRLMDFLKIDPNKYFGPGSKERLGKTRTFIEKIEQIFNAYRKEITGAQAAMREISMLRNSILNRKLTPTEFEYSYKSYIDKIKRQLRLKRMLLRKGVDENQIGQTLDRLYTSGGDVAESEIEARGDELKESGLTDEQVLEQLKREGYQ